MTSSMITYAKQTYQSFDWNYLSNLSGDPLGNLKITDFSGAFKAGIAMYNSKGNNSKEIVY